MPRYLTFLTVALLAGGFGFGAFSQTYPVTAGEHADFTRVVIQAPPGTRWSLDSETPQHQLTISPETARFDLSRLFERIPRTRLVAAQTQPGLLNLTIGCDCETLAWEERPGLIVIDLRDKDADDPAMLPVPAAGPSIASTPQQTAHAAGLALADAHTRAQNNTTTAQTIAPQASQTDLTRSLGMPIAQALSQGLLEPAVTTSAASLPSLLMNDSGLPINLPENMQVATVIDRQNPEAPPTEATPEVCQATRALGFLLSTSMEPFDVEFGRLTRALYGEFDQPNPEARRDLIELYLQSGFGAEARALIENESGTFPGRDLLLGISDVLEHRSSNSRMRLGQFITCDGPASLLAALAGAQLPDIARQSAEIALVFTEFPATLRTILGADLATILIDADAVDAARVVAGSTLRSPWTDARALDLVDALLDRARGNTPDAVARLQHAQGVDPASVQARLSLALEEGDLVDGDALADAEALASTERSNAIGTDLMASVIRLYTRAQAYSNAFSTLDRLQAWGPEHGETARERSVLRNELWLSVAENADELTMMRSILGRDDWEGASLDLETRQVLARRLLDLGLGGPVLELLHGTSDDVSADLLGRAFVTQDQPERAIEAIDGLSTPEAQRTRAEALSAMGLNASAAQQFEAIDANREARRAAILAQDWNQFQRLSDPERDAAADDIDLVGHVMGQTPGFQELAIQTQAAFGSTTAPIPVTTQVTATPRPDPSGTTPANASQLTPRETPAMETAIPATPAIDEVRQNEPAPAQVIADFDRLGLITRSATLLDESARLRDVLTPLLGTISDAAP